MRAGGGKAKGSNFERDTCRLLSLWLSRSQRADLFTRNVLSGGAFTIRTTERGIPGDVAASDPLSHEFLSLYSIECKHHADLKLSELLLKPQRLSSFGKIIAKAEEQAAETQRYYLIVAKQNNRDTVIFTPEIVGTAITEHLRYKRKKLDLVYHLLFGGDVFCMRFSDFTTYVAPDTLKGLPYVTHSRLALNRQT